jgi:hypothetical protein
VEPYTWIFRQVGQRNKWQPIQLAALPYPPERDDRITIQRFASPQAKTGDIHKSSFILDFDSHADWLNVDLCRIEVLRFLTIFQSQWGITPEQLQLFFSGRSGFHVLVPATLFGDIASPHLTSAYRRIATALKDTGLITLDAPSRHEPSWWWEHITGTFGSFPLNQEQQDAFALSLRGPCIYTRKRVIRRENSQHPGSGLYKVQVLPHELHYGMAYIQALARQPRTLPARPLPAINGALADFLQHLLTTIQVEEQRCQERSHHRAEFDGAAWVDGHPPPIAAGTPICMQRLLEQPAPLGSSNMLLVLLLSYFNARRLPEEKAVELARQWLVRGLTDGAKRAERCGDAHRIARTVYKDRYTFARRFVAPHALADDDECIQCPLLAWCWREGRSDAEEEAAPVP